MLGRCLVKILDWMPMLTLATVGGFEESGFRES